MLKGPPEAEEPTRDAFEPRKADRNVAVDSEAALTLKDLSTEAI